MSEEQKNEIMQAAPQAVSSPATSGDSAALMGVICNAAANPAIEIDKLERIMALYKDVNAQKAQNEYSAAMADMQQYLPVIRNKGQIKIGTGAPQTYAKWEDINPKIIPVLAEHGFSLTFRTNAANNKVTVTGILSHASGHHEETAIELPIDTSGSKNAVQAIGSSLSYGKRYCAIMLLNLTTTDEDDNGASGMPVKIDESQADQLLDLAGHAYPDAETKAKFMAWMCGKFKIGNISELPASKFRTACEVVNDEITKVEANRRKVAEAQKREPGVEG